MRRLITSAKVGKQVGPLGLANESLDGCSLSSRVCRHKQLPSTLLEQTTDVREAPCMRLHVFGCRWRRGLHSEGGLRRLCKRQEWLLASKPEFPWGRITNGQCVRVVFPLFPCNLVSHAHLQVSFGMSFVHGVHPTSPTFRIVRMKRIRLHLVPLLRTDMPVVGLVSSCACVWHGHPTSVDPPPTPACLTL